MLVRVCVYPAHSLCARVKARGHSFLRMGFVVWLKKKSHVQHFKLSFAGEKLSFLEEPTYLTERSGHGMKCNASGCLVLIL